MKKTITVEGLGDTATFSHAVEANGLVFVSGQVHANADWQLVGETVPEKLDAIFDNIRAILASVDLTIEDIVKATVYVTDMAQMKELNESYPRYFHAASLPAREAVCVKELPLGATIEISVIAAK